MRELQESVLMDHIWMTSEWPRFLVASLSILIN